MSNADFYIVSGTSGSGKTIALQVLEDIGYYCIDNLPASLAPDLAVRMMGAAGSSQKCAISIDSRNHDLLSDLDASIKQLSALDINLRIVFLDADDPTLLKRYSETRRKHPLSDPETSLREAIDKERSLLEKLALLAHRRIDTSTMTPHELRTLVREDAGNKGGYAVLFYYNRLALNTEALSMLILYLTFAACPTHTGTLNLNTSTAKTKR